MTARHLAGARLALTTIGILLGLLIISGSTFASDSDTEDAEDAEKKTLSAPAATGNSYSILAHNDLGMHCADSDYQIFSILPPYNVVNAQVLRKGGRPQLMSPADGIEVTYQAVQSNIVDPNDDNAPPSAIDSINTTSANAPFAFKGNFWELSGNGLDAFGFLAYDPLYPPGVLGMFPFELDLGLPAPDVEELYLGSGVLTAEQSAMPGIFDPYNANDPQPFHGFVEEFPFFIGDHDGNGAPDFPFGYTAANFMRYTAEGIPIMPTDDQGRSNTYPLMRIQAHAQGVVVAEVDAVLPVASEADCQGCHLAQEVCTGLGLGIPCDDIAHHYDRGAEFVDGGNVNTSDPANPNYVPGDTAEQIALNAAKINILRLHDAKNTTALDNERNIVCAKCHYSPALDLAHLGPNDENGKEQTQHISMSRAMHSFHGNLPTDAANDPDGAFADLFPTMPPPGGRSLAQQDQILEETCYNCHPGKRTKCLRGAMETGGMVCQDCHGQSTQVGNDFSASFPTNPGSAQFDQRVPWANEPACQSCHVGDVQQVNQLKNSGQLDDAVINGADKGGNTDDLRLLMAYPLAAHSAQGGGDDLDLFAFDSSRFASNLPLYRLSGGDDGSDKGHGGLSCEGCHGSTHAIWPNANPWANDNKTAMDLQGHRGTIIECSTCHEGDLGNTLEGPHGMHSVGGTSFVDGGHEKVAEDNADACRSCHGMNGEGTVLSRAATDRTFTIEECEEGTLCPGGEQKNFTVNLEQGQPVACNLCHKNEL
ncbi:MAG: cytochrome C [Pseudomonadota bacterium]|nr:cytochrome C [Pseudomonadota bacterium]